MANYNYSKYERTFKSCSKYKWEVTDAYGKNLSNSQMRDSKINKVLNDEELVDAIYSITLRKVDERGWGLYHCTFFPKESLLKFWPLGEESGVRVDLFCEDINDADPLVDMIIKGNKMEVMPAHLV